MGPELQGKLMEYLPPSVGARPVPLAGQTHRRTAPS